MKATLHALLALVIVLAVLGVAVGYSVARRGISTRTEPSRVEDIVARAMRGFATPSEVRMRRNPVEPTNEVIAEALEHYADHCATCHTK